MPLIFEQATPFIHVNKAEAELRGISNNALRTKLV
jgi:hypothetical protein